MLGQRAISDLKPLLMQAKRSPATARVSRRYADLDQAQFTRVGGTTSNSVVLPCDSSDRSARRSAPLCAVQISALRRIATSVRFFAFNFFIIFRTWTFTVLSHMFIS